MEKNRFDRDKNVHEQFLKMNSDIRYELMEIVKSVFLPWVKDGYAIPVRHFMYDGICSSCYALFVKNEGDEIWITGCVKNKDGHGSLSYVTTPIEDLDNYYLSKVIDEILLVHSSDPESVIPIEQCRYPQAIYWACS